MPQYTGNPLHRNGSPVKSQWTVSEEEEVVIFEAASAAGWLTPQEGWGLRIIDGDPRYLGISQDRLRSLFIAKFVGTGAPPVWHGYPADHQLHRQDVPHEFILRRWLDGQLLAPAKVRKIMRAQACRL